MFYFYKIALQLILIYCIAYILEPISCISSTQDNMCTLVSCTDSTLKLMDRQKGELLNEYDILFFKFEQNTPKSLYIILIFYTIQFITGIQVTLLVIILLKTVYFIMIVQ